MVDAVLSVVPSSLARYIHIIYAIIILPLEIFIPYQAFQSMNPLLLGIGAGCGLNSYQVLTCLNISYLNPCSPSGGGGQPGLRAGRGGYHQAGKIFGDPLYCL